MTLLDLIFDRKTTISMEDYGDFIGNVLKLNINFTIVQYNLTEHGVKLRISFPEEKIHNVMAILKENGIKYRSSTISIDEDLCVHCGACISLCSTDALYYKDDYQRGFDESKCVGCKLCVDACTRNCISYS